MKLTMFIGLVVMILLCVVGFTQNEFITDPVTTLNENISSGITFDSVRTWDTVNLEIVEFCIIKNTAPVTLIKNDGNFPNPFNYSLGTDQYAISRTDSLGTVQYVLSRTVGTPMSSITSIVKGETGVDLNRGAILTCHPHRVTVV